MTLILAAVIGVVVGFLGGLLGKGGSAIATPMLHAVGVPAIVAIAAPLPAAIPSTLAAGYAYSRQHLVDWRVVRSSALFGVPATIIGAGVTRWIGGGVLVAATDLLLIALGGRLVWSRRRARTAPAHAPRDSRRAIAAVAIAVGLVSGVLANSGGFLLAPLYLTVLRLPIKTALASSLAVASLLAVPGTIVHAYLGHIDWALVAVFGAASVPLSFLGARIAIRIDAGRLEGIYGFALVAFGTIFLALR